MAQKTNLNISPYYDDFDSNKNYYKVLFKPGFPIQARELSTLQSIFQNQLESFGSNIFKDGSMVVPGSVTYDDKYYSVQINYQHLGVDVSLYVSELVGKKIKGQTSGVEATIVNYDIPPSNDVTNITLYVKYSSSGNDLERVSFEDNELLIILETIIYGGIVINSGETIASLISQNSCAVGSAVLLERGVYFIRGTFVSVENSTLVLSAFSNLTNYRVGLTIFEDIITSTEDVTLNDNAKGFSNYAAPGADRFRIRTALSKKSLDDFEDKDFIELVKIQNGEIKKIAQQSDYSIIKDYIAKRTYEESGDYTVNNFTVGVQECLNDQISNNGIYLSSEKTQAGSVPSESLVCLTVSPGKAYVKGFDVDIPSTVIIDTSKPRDTGRKDNVLLPFEMGNLLRVNNVFGTPYVGTDNNYNTINLFNQRRNSNTAGTGTLMGRARIYSYNLSDSSYRNNSSIWDLYLFDIQLYTVLSLNETLTATQCPATSLIRGVSSGASGYVVTSASSKDITLSQISGRFIPGEQILINERLVFSRSIVSIREYNTEDIKSVYQDTSSFGIGISADFVADTVLNRSIENGFSVSDRITIGPSGIATCAGRSFVGIRSDAIIRYQKSGIGTETYNRVVSVSSDGLSLTLASTPTVLNVSDGTLPTTETTTTFSLGVPNFKDEFKSSLYSPLPNKNIAAVNLSKTSLTIVSQVRGVTTDALGAFTLSAFQTGISSALFVPYDNQRYSIAYSDGTVAPLTSDQFTLSSDSSQITVKGLRTNQSNVVLNATLRKIQTQSATKTFVRSEQLVVSRTSAGITTITSGLTTSPYYGLRLEDPEISLNVPDAVNLVAVYESLDSANPVIDKLEIGDSLGLNLNSIIGEKVIGDSSGAVAQIVTRNSSTEIGFVYLSARTFSDGEVVRFAESGLVSTVKSTTKGNYLDITERYTLDKGHRDQYCDYARIKRKSNSLSPSKKLLIIFDYYDVLSNNSGDFLTANSYTKERYSNDIPILSNNVRATDTIDFRPRVSRFIGDGSSPFDFASRQFSSNVFSSIVSPNESSVFDYDYYLPRIDKIYLNLDGAVYAMQGVSSDNPKPPFNNDAALELATIYFPPYLYDIKDVKISLKDNKRYTMRDIGKLEDRIENLELVTSLSLLEVDTKTLQIQDADGLSRFKSGFFVDDFSSDKFISKSTEVKVDVDKTNKELSSATDYWSLKGELALPLTASVVTTDYSQDVDLLDSNVVKRGDLLMLKYEEVGFIEQPLASNVENVNPFFITEFSGNIELNPSSDNWVRNIYVNNSRVSTTGALGEFTYLEGVVTSGQADNFMRSRNVEFVVSGIKPLTQHYFSMDGVSSIDFIPKLLEISMASGIFSVGETVDGFVANRRVISFRLASPDHKSGTFNSPSDKYIINPYDRLTTLETSYSAASTILNVDTKSLSEESLTSFGGYLEVGASLVGRTSGATAVINQIRLVSDNFGDLTGSFFIRDPNSTPPPLVRIPTGEKQIKISSSNAPANELVGGIALLSNAYGTYRSSGIIITQTSDFVDLRNPLPPPPPPIFITNNFITNITNITNNITNVNITNVIANPPPPPPPARVDPLAQSFVSPVGGAFLTSVDVYFGSKDEVEPIEIQLRAVELGTPTLLPVTEYARVVYQSSQIKISNDASVPTNIKFKSPIYLRPDTEYALVFLSPKTDKYQMWVGTMGQKTVNTKNLPDIESVIVNRQYIGGSLFKSQNGSVWTSSQYQDLKFKLYKANFTSSSGEVTFYNPSITPDASEAVLPYLQENPIRLLPRKLKVGITTNIQTAVLSVGRKVSEGPDISTPGPVGTIERIGGPLVPGSSGITRVNSGTGYPASGSYSNVPLYTITGSGDGATASVTFTTSGELSTISIASTGNGYAVGDVLGITTSSVVKGTGARISVTSAPSIDTLYLTNVVGEEFTLSSNLLYYGGPSETTVIDSGADIRTSSTVMSPLDKGNVFEVNQYNHGMHGYGNRVKIIGVEPDSLITKTTSDFDIGDTLLNVVSSTSFETFEGSPVTVGYLIVNNEIMEYVSAANGVLTISQRGVDGSGIRKHLSGSNVQKYEISGVSLRRINNTHNVSDLLINPELKDYDQLDSYYLTFDRSDRPSGDSQLSFIEGRSVGGKFVKASQNYQFSSFRPQVNFITPGFETEIKASVRTVTGTSADGNETSFVDRGYEPVLLNEINYFNTPRMVCSRINETTRLASLPQNKSLSLRLRLNRSSTNSDLSPVVDFQNVTMVLGRNRLNQPILDYASDSRSNLTVGDPHSSVYISNKISLKQPASSLKLIISACRPSGSNFRALYKLYKTESSEVDQSFILFPGYENLRDTNGDGVGDQVIDPSRNNGLPDAYVRESGENEFLEYQFTADGLGQFNAFEIKIVMSSTNESSEVKLKDLRVIALA